MNYIKYILRFAPLCALLVMTSCFDDLNTVPIDDDEVTSANVYDDPTAYKGVLAKLYSGLALTGQQGPAGQPDISGIDEGFGQYLRGYFYLQEFTTDEALIAWNDQTIQEFHTQQWSADDGFIYAFYSRVFYQISACNEFLRETTDEKLTERGVDGTLRDEINQYRAEARFLRALSYFHALDAFRNVPFVTEEDPVGSFFPEQGSPQEVFNYIESELLAINDQLTPPRSNEYARADQAAAWMVLAKLYLNAEVYVGTDRYADCANVCNDIINAGYQLDDNYRHLFMADNHNSDEIIFPVAFDGTNTQTFGGMTFLTHAPVGGSMSPADYGIDGGWGGIRTTKTFVEKFTLVVPGETVVARADRNDSYPVLYVPGSFYTIEDDRWNPGGANTLQLSSPDNNGLYEGYIYMAAGSEFKITTMPNWDVNYGDTGADGSLEENGDNLSVAEDGLYKINVDINSLMINVEKMTWGLIGSSTPDEWNSDQDMTYNAELNAMEIRLNLIGGEIKFRANDAWDVNLGDSGNDGIMEYGGDNIGISKDGLYDIKLFLENADYTYQIEKIGSEGDSRGNFYTDGQSLDILDVSQFTQGYAVEKYVNVASNGMTGVNLTHPDTDFPLFRLADAYLMYAEAARRGGGDLGQAVTLVNELQERAYGSDQFNISANELTLDFLIDERARELHWECHRRTDLVRFDRFTGCAPGECWQWKGGAPEGASVPEFRNIFPIPSNDLTANPNLSQNPNY